MKIHTPFRDNPFVKKGQIVLRYRGDNLQNLNMRAFKTAKFELRDQKSRYSTSFKLVFDEYFEQSFFVKMGNGQHIITLMFL